MQVIIKSCFDQNNDEYLEYLVYMLEIHKEHKAYGISLLGEGLNLNVLEFMVESYENSLKFPSEKLFLMNFPDLPKDIFNNISIIPLEDFHVCVANYLKQRVNIAISNRMKELIGIVAKDGLTQEIAEEIDALKKLSNKSAAPDIQLRQYSCDNYAERLNKPLGMKTGIPQLDDLIGGMNEGTVSVIAGFTSHYKTMFAINIARLNAYNNGYNIAYFSLETPKDIMYDQYLSRHSYDMKFQKYDYIPHVKIHRCALSQEEQDYLFNTIEPDLYQDFLARDGKIRKRGLTTFFDLSDFETFSFSEISNVLEALDDKLNGRLDALIVDYVQLCKFMEGGAHLGDDNRIINSYVAFFRKLAQGFRSGSKKKKLIVILLSQINRESWKKASKNKDNRGCYDLTCLADANELERGASRVFTTYTSENMKFNKEAQVQLLKNRHGQTMTEPKSVYADPEPYFFGEENDSFGQTVSSTAGSTVGSTMLQKAIDDILSALDNQDYSAPTNYQSELMI